MQLTASSSRTRSSTRRSCLDRNCASSSISASISATFPLQKPKVELFTNKVLRPRLVYATGVRVGLATGLGGQEIPISERFVAGGGTTVRGFQQNSLGSAAPGVNILGGNAMLVLNNEIRF